MKLSPILPIALGLALFTGCATYSVRADYDTSANYTAYKTFDWYAASKYAKGKTDGGASAIMDRRVRHAVEKQLTAKGFQLEKKAEPDFLVTYYPVYRNRQVVTTTNMGGGLFWRPFHYGMSSAVSEVRNIKEGSIILEIVDYKTNEMIWQAVADGALTDLRTPEDADEVVADAVERMLEKFPPHGEKK
ncbi:DUF4136 domain-containing protein [Holophaga foetida]|uniref:DUF4136 domain-containing protein n=1 Tax=Holophaga foetida TaxID=35839 RepID=UPI0002474628|nr:DUF4136 domain-containing protein [Holophaga foetida]